MELKGMSRYKLAKEIPCSQASVGNWLNGVEPTPLMRKRITEILGELPKETPASTEASGEDAEFLNLYHRATPMMQNLVVKMLREAESFDATQGDDSKE
jgi:hypothetical protein